MPVFALEAVIVTEISGIFIQLHYWSIFFLNVQKNLINNKVDGCLRGFSGSEAIYHRVQLLELCVSITDEGF